MTPSTRLTALRIPLTWKSLSCSVVFLVVLEGATYCKLFALLAVVILKYEQVKGLVFNTGTTKKCKVNQLKA